MMLDDTHPDGERQLFVWEAMTPVLGRQRIVGFSKGLVDAGLKPRTVQTYLGSLRRLFQYVLEYPCIPDTQVQSLVSNGVFSNRVDRWRSPNLAGIRATHVQKNWRSCTLKNNGSYRMFGCLKSGNGVK